VGSICTCSMIIGVPFQSLPHELANVNEQYVLKYLSTSGFFSLNPFPITEHELLFIFIVSELF